MPTPRQLRNMARQRFNRSRLAEVRYERQLAQVGRHIGTLVRGMAPEGIVSDLGVLQRILLQYSNSLEPWAFAVVRRMQAEVSLRDIRAWAHLGREIGQSLKKEILTAPTGQMLREEMQEQIKSITSLPIEAAQRLSELTLKGITEGTRTPEIMEAILNSGHVSVSRARLIARTQVATTASKLTEVRARHIGAEQYTWVSSHDSDVRPLHRKLDGRVFSWDDPPISGENGERSHPGQIYNCRCWPSPIIPD